MDKAGRREWYLEIIQLNMITNFLFGKKVFISFAIEDQHLRNLLVGQKKNSRNNIKFRDRSLYDAFESKWKTQCRDVIQECDGVIGIITKNTILADGQQWEIKCALEENIPILLVRPSRLSLPKRLPEVLSNQHVYVWKQEKIWKFCKQC